MNEIFGADPCSPENSSDLKYLLDKFGPFSGRYLAELPQDWSRRVEGTVSQWPPIEFARAQTLLRRAREGGYFAASADLLWEKNETWLHNVLNVLDAEQNRVSGAIVSRGVSSSRPNVFVIDEIELPPTADELIIGRPEEYVRTCKSLLEMSHEVVIVDPHFDPTVKFVTPVLEAIVSLMVQGKGIKLSCWARTKALLGEGKSPEKIPQIRAALKQVANQHAAHRKFDIELFLVDDSVSRNRLHARYLLSIKGGIRFDQGFKTFFKRPVEVGVIARSVHDSLVHQFIERKNELLIDHLIAV